MGRRSPGPLRRTRLDRIDVDGFKHMPWTLRADLITRGAFYLAAVMLCFGRQGAGPILREKQPITDNGMTSGNQTSSRGLGRLRGLVLMFWVFFFWGGVAVGGRGGEENIVVERKIQVKPLV